jgi:hypothetical protein
MESCVWRGCALAGLVACLAMLTGGCSIYLHDDALQKQTDSLLSTYKAADVPGGIRNTLAAQQQFDKNILDSVVTEDAAIRDAELAGLLGGSDGAKAKADRLLDKINNRLAFLGGGYTFDGKDWADLHEVVATHQQQITDAANSVNVVAAQYRAGGGTDFSTCPKFLPSGSGPAAPPHTDALKLACDNLLAAQEALADDTVPVAAALKTFPNGKLAQVNAQLAQIEEQAKLDSQQAATTANDLKRAKAAYDKATKDSKTVDQTVTDAFSTFTQALHDADKAAGTVGATNYKPSVLLETIRFKKTNICDVIAAGASTSCSGSSASDAAKDANKAVVGLLAGLAKVANFDQPPSEAVLSVALAYQTALEAVAQAQVDGLQARKALLENEQASLSEEVQLLLQARVALQKPTVTAAWSSKSCQVGSVGDLFQLKTCVARDAVAEALTAYSLSWARGRTAARIDELRLAQLNTTQALQIAQANAVARDAVISTALTEIDKFGQGGVSAQTVASFLQAAGIGAIAKGVN